MTTRQSTSLEPNSPALFWYRIPGEKGRPFHKFYGHEIELTVPITDLFERHKSREYVFLTTKIWLKARPYLWCLGYKEIIQVEASRVKEDLEQNGIALPPELADPTVGQSNPLREWACDPRIIATLRAVGHRLTTTPLLAEMSKRAKPGSRISESTVKRRLAVMVADKRLNKDPKAKPPGYGLPEWNDPSGS